MKKTQPANPQLRFQIRMLRVAARENDAKIWKSIAEDLSKTRKNRVCVNLSRINRHSDKDEIVVIAGKVLGSGTLRHPVEVAASSFSARAREKISEAKGKCLTFPELLKRRPKGSKVKIVG